MVAFLACLTAVLGAYGIGYVEGKDRIRRSCRCGRRGFRQL